MPYADYHDIIRRDLGLNFTAQADLMCDDHRARDESGVRQELRGSCPPEYEVFPNGELPTPCYARRCTSL